MFKLRVFVFVVITVSMFVSCSRSLTDYGYQGGPGDTVDMFSVGKNQFFSNVYTLSISSNCTDSHYRGEKRKYYYVDKEKNDTIPLNSVEVKGLYFLQDFYTTLNNDFKQNKFSKKYSRSIDVDVAKEISSKAQADSTDIHHGWQIFNNNLSASGRRYVISYVGNLWYSVVAQNNPDAVVLVKLQPATKGKGFVISGLKNDDLNINVTE